MEALPQHRVVVRHVVGDEHLDGPADERALVAEEQPVGFGVGGQDHAPAVDEQHAIGGGLPEKGGPRSAPMDPGSRPDNVGEGVGQPRIVAAWRWISMLNASSRRRMGGDGGPVSDARFGRRPGREIARSG